MALKKYIPALTDANAYQVFQLLRIATVLVIGIMLVKAGLDKEAVSNYELFIFWGNILSFFWVMGVKNAAISYYPKLPAEKQKSFFFNLLILFQALGVLACILSGVIIYFYGSQSNELSSLGMYLPVYILLYAPTVLIEVIFILKNKAGRMLQYGIYIHILQFFTIFTTLLFSKEPESLFAALSFWMLIKWIYTIRIVYSYSEWRYSSAILKAFGWFCLPLVLHILLGNGMEYIDGLLVSRFFPAEQFAVFRFGARELPVFLVLIGALSSVLIPVGVNNVTEAAFRIRRETRKMMHLFFPLILLLLFISPALYQFFYSADYRTSAFIFNIYLLIFASRIIMVEVFMYAKHQNNFLMWISGLELLINLVFSLLLMQWFGMQGIAWGTVIAFATSKVFFIIFVHRKLGIPLTKYLNIKIYLAYSLMLYISHFVSWYLWAA